MSDRVVIVFGLAGSGKSTLANGLGAQLGLRVIHPSGIMRDLLEQKTVDLSHTRQNEGFWESEEGSRLLSGRLTDEAPIDLAVDKILLAEVSKGEVVIDSWSLPWLTSRGVRIHLLSDLQVRAGRAAARAGISVELARERISRKDEDTRQLFLKLYGFDIMERQESLFHFTLDTDVLGPEEVLAETVQFLRAQHGSTFRTV